MGWRKRSAGWEEALIARTRNLLSTVAGRHGLHCELDDEGGPVEVACTYPKQPGLDFDLSFWLFGDEFGCSGGQWSATIFPADGEREWELIERLVDGLVTGQVRIALFRSLGRSKPYWTEVQLHDGSRWKSVSTGVGCALIPFVRPTFIQNGIAARSGRFRPAYGAIALVVLLVAIGFWLF